MEKTIYQLLNEVETDFEEYEQTELSPEEKETYKQRILAEVKSMKIEEGRRKRKVWKKAAGLAAAFAVVAGAVGLAANPALAKQIFSSVFGNVIATTDGTFSGQKELQEKIAGKSSTIQEELDKQQDLSGYAASAECNGVTLAVSDVYCDGSALYYTLSLWTDNEDMNKAERVFLYLQDGVMHTPIFEGSNGEEIRPGGTLASLKKADNGSYVCMNDLDLYDLSEEEREALQIEDGGTLNVRYELDGLTGVVDVGHMDEQGRCKETARVEGEWNLRFPVTVDASEKEVIEINKEENGIIVKSIIKTDTTLVVEVDYSGYAADDENCLQPQVDVEDSEGNSLIGLGGSGSNGELCTTLARVLYDGQKDLVIFITGAGEENEKIAEIPVQLP